MAKLQVLLALCALLFIAGTSSVDAGPGLVESVVKAPQYSKLVEALTVAGLVDDVVALIKTKPITVFAPDNAAFAALPPKLATFLTTTPKGKKILADILLYHVVAGKFAAPKSGSVLINLLKQKLYISSYYYKLYVNKVLITKPALINVPEGVVHGIKSVLIPPQYAHLVKSYYPQKHYTWGWGWPTWW
jgi:uncharacterized surface protein with fasciclin (FAS1) repeats